MVVDRRPIWGNAASMGFAVHPLRSLTRNRKVAASAKRGIDINARDSYGFDLPLSSQGAPGLTEGNTGRVLGVGVEVPFFLGLGLLASVDTESIGFQV